MEKPRCTDCGREITEGGFFEESHSLCDGCASPITDHDPFFQCAKCGLWLHEANSVEGDGVTCECGAWTPIPE